MRTTYIYGVWDLGIQKFVYAGKSNMPPIRFKVHMKYSSNEDLRELVAEKGAESFGLIILEKTGFFTPRGWVKREKFWVKKFRKEGHPLCNKNDGGQGPTEHTEETLAKMGVALSGDNNPRGFLGKHHTKETLVKLSKPRSEKTKAKMRKPKSEKTKAKISKANMGHEVTEETRAKISRANTGKKHSESHRAKLANASAKPYPAFYNEVTGEYIPAGYNLKLMCEVYKLNPANMGNLRSGNTRCSLRGWRLA